MNAGLYVPKKLKVGYRERLDTYSKKLAYVIYYDEKNKLRKENSWNSWRDSKMVQDEYENAPTSGFVLNKNVGDCSNDWDHRAAYIRVYDPRGFEIEITLPNLLYILRNSSSLKGGSLDGEFVYSWDGKDLVLLPTTAPEYKEIATRSNVMNTGDFIKPVDLILGATYKTKNGTNLVYLGRMDRWVTKRDSVKNPDWNHSSRWHVREMIRIDREENAGKYFWFCHADKELMYGFQIVFHKSISGKLVECVNSNPVANYPELMDFCLSTTNASPIDNEREEWKVMTMTELKSRYYSDARINGKIERLDTLSDGCRFYPHAYYIPIADFVEKFKPEYKVPYLKNGNVKRG